MIVKMLKLFFFFFAKEKCGRYFVLGSFSCEDADEFTLLVKARGRLFFYNFVRVFFFNLGKFHF